MTSNIILIMSLDIPCKLMSYSLQKNMFQISPHIETPFDNKIKPWKNAKIFHFCASSCPFSSFQPSVDPPRSDQLALICIVSIRMLQHVPKPPPHEKCFQFNAMRKSYDFGDELNTLCWKPSAQGTFSWKTLMVELLQMTGGHYIAGAFSKGNIGDELNKCFKILGRVECPIN